jgi:hypothetical protein
MTDARTRTIHGGLVTLLVLLLGVVAPAQEHGTLILGTEPEDCTLDCQALGWQSQAKRQPWVLRERLPAGSYAVRLHTDSLDCTVELPVMGGMVSIYTVVLEDGTVRRESEARGKVPEAYEDRFDRQLRAVKRAGGSKESEAAVAAGLAWLAAHQCADGRWDVDGFAAECARSSGNDDPEHEACPGFGESEHGDPGVTGLALLAFLGAGNTLHAGPHRQVVRRGVAYLQGVQGERGIIGPAEGHYMYNHAIATQALAEAHVLSVPTPSLRNSVRRALEQLEQAQRPNGGWRYTVEGKDADTSVTAWCVQALVTAQRCGLEVPESCLTAADAWLVSVTDTRTGVVGYRSPGDPGARLLDARDRFPNQGAMIGAGILSRVLLGTSPRNRLIKLGRLQIKEFLPEWGPPKLDLYGWYYNSHALVQVGGPVRKPYARALLKALLPNQETEGGLAGSWPPVGPWGSQGGRVYSTAMAVLCLESCYRYGRP